VLESRVYVYNFADLRLIDAIDTCNNPKGLCALNPDGPNAVLATPASQKGFVRVALYQETNTNTSFKAHDNMIDNMTLTNDGTILVTASEVGTIFRLFFTNQKGSTQPVIPFQEVRRGLKNAVICSLAFDRVGRILAASSDHGTIHLFAVENPLV
jgi:WD repeat-containing protein 45